MKFLCVKCDEQMKLKATISHAEIGSLSVLYHCPRCEYEIAMLTNPSETQMVSSLGVKINPANEKEASISKCPFANRLQEGTADQTTSDISWTAPAMERLGRIPDVIRPVVKAGVEKFAKEQGYQIVNEKVLEEARAQFGM